MNFIMNEFSIDVIRLEFEKGLLEGKIICNLKLPLSFMTFPYRTNYKQHKIG